MINLRRILLTGALLAQSFVASLAYGKTVIPVKTSKEFFDREFEFTKACFILINAKTGTIEDQFGQENCRQQLAPLSTFKIPLALMAFDSKYFSSPGQIIKWSGTDYGNPNWNKDQTPKTFIDDSVIWVSHKIVEQLGVDKVRKYLKDFSYGNQIIGGDIQKFWLTWGSLKISSQEQAEFLAKLWTQRLPVGVQAASQLRDVLKSGNVGSIKVFGKTGSGCVEGVCDGPMARHYGWFSGVIEVENKVYSFALQYSDLLPSQGWAGPKAKKIFYRYLEENAARFK